MKKKDFKSQLKAYEEIEKTTSKIMKESEARNKEISESIKICIRIPKDLLILLKENKLKLEKDGVKTTIQDQVIEAIKKTYKKSK